MLKPLTTMVRVLLILLFVSTRTYSKTQLICNNPLFDGPKFVDVTLQPDLPFELVSTSELNIQPLSSYLQFSCKGNNSTSVTVEISVSDKNITQIITEDIIIDNSYSLYEIPLFASLQDALLNTNSKIQSVKFYNNSAYPVVLNNIGFSKTTVYEEIKIDQVVNLAINNNTFDKKYYVSSEISKPVTLKVYNSNGLLLHKNVSTINKGNTEIRLDDINLSDGEFIVVLSDNKKYLNYPNYNTALN